MQQALDRRLRPTRPRRALALAALVLGVLGTALVVLEVLSDPLYVLWLGATLVGGVVALVVALTTRDRWRHVATLALVGVVGLFVAGVADWVARRDGGVGRLALGALALALAGLAARLSLQPPPVERDVVVDRARWPVQRPVLLINPHSGGGAAERAGLAERCEALGVQTVVLGPDDDLAALAEAAVADGADALGMAGGDGSLGVVATVALAHDLPFVCVPAGTRNHFALDIGLDRDDPAAALDAWTVGVEHRVDVATVNGRVFLNNVALGAYGAVVANPGYRDDKVGTTLAELPDVVAKEGAAYTLELDVPGAGHWTEAATILVANNPYELRPPRAFGRRLRLDGGELGVVAVDVEGSASLVTITARAAFQAAEGSPHVWTWTTDHLEIGSPSDEVPAGVDGEAVTLTAPIRFTSRPRALRLLVPPDARVGLHRQDPTVTTGLVAGLLDVVLGNDGDDATTAPDDDR